MRMTGLRRFDVNYLWVLLLAVPAVLPLFQSGYLDSHDGLFHLYRLQALDGAFQAGVFYPRWFPQLAFGYGHPVLNYYSPLTYYVAQFFHLLGPGYLLSVKLTFAAGFMLSGVFVYLYAREVLGRFPGLIAAGVYTYFPYHLADTYLRGALAEAFAFVFLPLCLWAMFRLVTRERARYLIPLSVSFAGLIVTHNLTALIFTPVLVAYMAWLWFLTRRSRGALLALISLAVGFLLDSFYWLPVLLETRYVGLGANITAPGYQRHLAPVLDFISTSPLFRYLPDLGGGFDNPFYPLGVIYALLILAGMALLFWLMLRPGTWGEDSKNRRWRLLFFLVVTVGSIFMMLTWSLPLWRLAQPILAPLQYPWRFLALTSLGVAMVAGSLFAPGEGAEQAAGRRRWIRYGLGLGLLTVLLVYGLADLPKEMLPLEDSQVTVQRMWEEDFAARQIGATWTAEYVPIWVKADRSVVALPPPDLVPFEPRDLSPEEIPEIELGRQGLLSGQMVVASPEGYALRFHTFYFPGWKVYVDGQEAPVYPSGDLALLTVDIPPGEHQVLVRFEDTAPRLAGNLVALLTALGLLAFAVFRWRWKAAVTIAILGVLLVVLVGWHVRPFQFGTEPQQLEVNLEDQVKLLGYDLDQESYRPGDTVQLTLYWLGLQEQSQNYKVFVHFMDQGLTTMWAQHDGDPVGGFTPTTRWMAGEVVVDRHALYIPPETPPGTYKLFTGMYEWETVRNLTILTPEAASLNNRILLGEVEVAAP
ncbi:MAG TPA: 6-pyruvoyl-tetrahydropterin synthase-related protein [Anaerolineae bacterium]|nr:6-pyruvoyl-tetrahydropterin synthase-related protein [Anaerolineae bacterium]